MTARLVLLLAAVVSLASPNDRAPGREHLERVRVFADTLLENGIDRYGAVATPAWVSMLDLDTLRIPERKDPLWQRSYDAEDYMRNARGSNLYRDLATVEVFNQLSELTGDPKYGAAASAYLSWFMERCASPKTGLFAWGEHMFYNVVRDELEANRHELERQLPLWELMWRLNPRAVKRGIDAIYDYHIYDKKTFAFDRHGNYYTGLFDDPHVRGAYAKHSGLYAYSFMFLYTKTHEPKYLEWALKAGRMFWEIRHPKTNLIGNVWTPAGNGPTNIPPQLAWYLFRAYQLDRRQTALRDIAVSFVRAYVRAAWDPLSGRFYRDIDVSSAKPTGSYQAPWGDVQGETGFQGQAVVAAYNETKDPEFLVYARRYAQFILNDPVPATVRPETYGKNITFCLLYTSRCV